MPKQAPADDVFDRLAQETEAVSDETDIIAAAESDDAPAAESDDAPDTAPATTSVRRLLLAGLVGVIVVAAVGLSAFLGWRLIQRDATVAAGRAALEAAKQYAVVLTTLNANDIDKNYQQALDGATGKFKEDYSQGSSHLRQILIDNKASGKGVVLDAAVKSATTTRVEVLLFVDQSISNAVLPQPRIDRNRVQMTMELVDGRWLASNVDII